MAVEIIGAVSTVKADVTAEHELYVATTLNAQKAGFQNLSVEVDPGNVTGTRYIKQLDADDDYRLRVATDSIVFQENFAGAALNSAQWTSVVTTFTTSVAGGYLRLNNGASAAANGVARVQSYRSFSVEHSAPLYIEFPMQYVAAAIQLNCTVEVGWFIASGTSAPTDGVLMRINAAGELRLVSNYGGVETQSDAINLANLPLSSDVEILLVINTIEAELWFDNVLVVKLERSNLLPSLTQSTSLPITFRVYNGAVAPALAVQVLIGAITVTRGGITNEPDYGDFSALSGWGGYQGQSGGTMGQTANYTNSAEPVAAVLSNTAAGYATLGGQFSFAAVVGAATDYALFAFLVPVMAAGSYNRNLLIRGISISTVNSVVAVATTATILQWAIAVGSTAASLATGEAATTKAPRRIAVGMQAFKVGDLVGAQAVDLVRQFQCPLLAEPGSYVQVILRVPVGTATATEIFRGTVTIDAQFM